MKQILQHLRTGKMELAELPCPQVGWGQLLIQTRASLISAGTERILVEFSQANLIQKARQQPDKVTQVLDKMKTDSLMPTLDTVFRKLDEPLPLGLLLFLRPNKWHYVSLGARLTPHAFHNWYNRLRGRKDEDTFPTLYKLNTASDRRRELGRAGFEEKQLILRECCPNYLTFSWPTFLFGVLYERIVSSCDLFARVRVNILGQYTKRA